VRLFPEDLILKDFGGRKTVIEPVAQTLTMPQETGADPDLISVLNRAIDAYHRQGFGPKFKVLTSKWGLHIVPDQVRDTNGTFVAAASPLEAKISVPPMERSVGGHMRTLIDAISASAGIRIVLSVGAGSPRGFDAEFRSRPANFVWGADRAVA